MIVEVTAGLDRRRAGHAGGFGRRMAERQGDGDGNDGRDANDHDGGSQAEQLHDSIDAIGLRRLADCTLRDTTCR